MMEHAYTISSPMSLKALDDGAFLYYKLTNEPKGSGELESCV